MFNLCKLCPTTTTVPLVFIYEKQVVLVPKRGKILLKINEVIPSNKINTPTAKSSMSQKEKSELKKSID